MHWNRVRDANLWGFHSEEDVTRQKAGKVRERCNDTGDLGIAEEGRHHEAEGQLARGEEDEQNEEQEWVGGPQEGRAADDSNCHADDQQDDGVCDHPRRMQHPACQQSDSILIS